eukprot:1365877-Amphidinium_carterae.1
MEFANMPFIVPITEMTGGGSGANGFEHLLLLNAPRTVAVAISMITQPKLQMSAERPDLELTMTSHGTESCPSSDPLNTIAPLPRTSQ